MTDPKNIISREVRIDEYQKETRWFSDSERGFDGTAGGYGYRTLEKLRKAYWYSKNRHKIASNDNGAKRFLKDNPEIRRVLAEYFSAENYVVAWKEKEELSFDGLLEDIKNDDTFENREEMIRKIGDAKPLWRSILKVLQRD
jgi:hypothetical protein